MASTHSQSAHIVPIHLHVWVGGKHCQDPADGMGCGLESAPQHNAQLGLELSHAEGLLSGWVSHLQQGGCRGVGQQQQEW
jgi:hypothetical protein